MILGEKMIDKIVLKKMKEGLYLYIEGVLLDKKLWYVDECIGFMMILWNIKIFLWLLLINNL